VLHQEVSDPCTGRAGEDTVVEGLRSDLASWAGWVWVLVEPRGVRGQITLRRPHLMDSSRQKLSQSDEGVWGMGGGIP